VKVKPAKRSRCPRMEEIKQQRLWGLWEKNNGKWLRGPQRRAVSWGSHDHDFTRHSKISGVSV
jgi:hypothetical protein